MFQSELSYAPSHLHNMYFSPPHSLPLHINTIYVHTCTIHEHVRAVTSDSSRSQPLIRCVCSSESMSLEVEEQWGDDEKRSSELSNDVSNDGAEERSSSDSE